MRIWLLLASSTALSAILTVLVLVAAILPTLSVKNTNSFLLFQSLPYNCKTAVWQANLRGKIETYLMTDHIKIDAGIIC